MAKKQQSAPAIIIEKSEPTKKSALESVKLKADQDAPVFSKANYALMGVGLALMVLGYILMMSDTEPYGLGFRGITYGPILVTLGFAVEFVAILYKRKS